MFFSKILFHKYLFPSQSRKKRKKLSEIFIFTLLCGVSKGFKKALKAFIKPFETPQRSVKIKIYLNFYFNTTFRNAQDGKGYVVLFSHLLCFHDDNLFRGMFDRKKAFNLISSRDHCQIFTITKLRHATNRI